MGGKSNNEWPVLVPPLYTVCAFKVQTCTLTLVEINFYNRLINFVRGFFN